jgi:hypothetical protein
MVALVSKMSQVNQLLRRDKRTGLLAGDWLDKRRKLRSMMVDAVMQVGCAPATGAATAAAATAAAAVVLPAHASARCPLTLAVSRATLLLCFLLTVSVLPAHCLIATRSAPPLPLPLPLPPISGASGDPHQAV